MPANTLLSQFHLLLELGKVSIIKLFLELLLGLFNFLVFFRYLLFVFFLFFFKVPRSTYSEKYHGQPLHACPKGH